MVPCPHFVDVNSGFSSLSLSVFFLESLLYDWNYISGLFVYEGGDAVAVSTRVYTVLGVAPGT